MGAVINAKPMRAASGASRRSHVLCGVISPYQRRQP
jgi:hypothetical protein